MNENDVLKQSVKVFIIGLIIFSIIGIFVKQVNFILGFILGYVISVLSFYIIILMSDIILKLGQTVKYVIFMFIIKMLLYAGGFILALKFNSIFNLISVFFGYFVIRITISVLGYLNRE